MEKIALIHVYKVPGWGVHDYYIDFLNATEAEKKLNAWQMADDNELDKQDILGYAAVDTTRTGELLDYYVRQDTNPIPRNAVKRMLDSAVKSVFDYLKNKE